MLLQTTFLTFADWMEAGDAVPIRSVYLSWWKPTSGCLLCSSMWADSAITGVETYDRAFEMTFHVETGQTDQLVALLNVVSKES